MDEVKLEALRLAIGAGLTSEETVKRAEKYEAYLRDGESAKS